MITSKIFSDVIGKKHKHVIDKIANEIKKNTNLKCEFTESTYTSIQNKNVKCYLLTDSGLKHLIKTTKDITLEMIQQLGVNDIDVIYSNSRFEISFINMLEEALDTFNIKGIKQYNVDRYRIDFYIPEYNIAVEYDEEQHYNKVNMKLDMEREKYIKSKLNCEFIRCDYKNSDIKNVMQVVRLIYNGGVL
ncbi:MAG: Rha family transcriptional regulator [Paraclostridium sp.]